MNAQQGDPHAFWERLEQLRDIHLPADPAWFPPAPGWWLLMSTLIACSTALFFWLRWRRRRLAPIQQALSELRLLRLHAGTGTQDARIAFVQSCNELMKRIARTRLQSKRSAAALTGEAWRGFLSETAPRMADPPPRILAHGAYVPEPEPYDAAELATWVAAWLRRQGSES